jgi:hypothetical protein
VRWARENFKITPLVGKSNDWRKQIENKLVEAVGVGLTLRIEKSKRKKR